MTTNITADCVFCGCGPACMATLVYLEQVGALESILQTTTPTTDHSLVIIDPAKKQDFGVGALGQYISPSNTSACMFALNVFRPRTVKAPEAPEVVVDAQQLEVALGEAMESKTSESKSEDSDVSVSVSVSVSSSSSTSVESAVGQINLLPSPLLNSLRSTPEAQSLTKKGAGFTRLLDIAPWQRRVMETLIEKRFQQQHSKGKIMSERWVERIVVRQDGKYDVYVVTRKPGSDNDQEKNEGKESEKNQTIIITTRKIMLSMGGKPKATPEWLKRYENEGMNTSITKKKSKKKKTSAADGDADVTTSSRLVMSADVFLRRNGFMKVFQHLRKLCGGQSIKKKAYKVIVIGGAHSALSVIHTLLAGADEKINSGGVPLDDAEYSGVSSRPKKERKSLHAAKIVTPKAATKKKKKSSPKASKGVKEKKIEEKKIEENKSEENKSEEKKNEENKSEENKSEEKKSEEKKSEDKNKEEKNSDSTTTESSMIPAVSAAPASDTLAMYQFMKDEILMLHRSDVHMYWFNKNEAKKAGVTVDPIRVSQNAAESVNVYTGLRGKSKSLWRAIKKGQESRVKAVHYSDGNKIEQKVFHAEPDVVIHAIGYGCALPLFLDESDMLPMTVDSDTSGTLKTTNSCQIFITRADSKKKELLKNIVATGLGATLRTTHPDIGGEKLMKNVKADGVNIYMNQQARVLSHALWGQDTLQHWSDVAQQERVRQQQQQKESEQEKIERKTDEKREEKEEEKKIEKKKEGTILLMVPRIRVEAAPPVATSLQSVLTAAKRTASARMERCASPPAPMTVVPTLLVSTDTVAAYRGGDRLDTTRSSRSSRSSMSTAENSPRDVLPTKKITLKLTPHSSPGRRTVGVAAKPQVIRFSARNLMPIRR